MSSFTDAHCNFYCASGTSPNCMETHCGAMGFGRAWPRWGRQVLGLPGMAPCLARRIWYGMRSLEVPVFCWDRDAAGKVQTLMEAAYDRQKAWCKTLPSRGNRAFLASEIRGAPFTLCLMLLGLLHPLPRTLWATLCPVYFPAPLVSQTDQDCFYCYNHRQNKLFRRTLSGCSCLVLPEWVTGWACFQRWGESETIHSPAHLHFRRTGRWNHWRFPFLFSALQTAWKTVISWTSKFATKKSCLQHV